MSERLTDYLFVAIVIFIIWILFRLSGFMASLVLKHMKQKTGELSSDLIISTGFFFLLAGLLFLPFITALFAFANNFSLVGKMPMHLILVALSIILFSIAEDLFRVFKNYPRHPDWTVSKHFLILIIPTLVFWLIGILFISPLFYSGLTVILLLFYLFALKCRPYEQKPKSGTG